MKQQNMKKIKPGLMYGGIIALILFVAPGCNKWAAVPAPVNSLNSVNVYTTNTTAAAVLTNIYARMSQNGIDFAGAGFMDMSDLTLSVIPGLSGDELTLFDSQNTGLEPYYTNSMTGSTFSIQNTFWNNGYNLIFICNSALEGLEGSTTLTPAVKQQLLGEVYFMRAFYYFYLVNLYGDVPLVLNTDYKTNATLARTSKDKVYQQIIADLKQAQSLLSANYLDATVTKTTTARVRPTKWAATALLARAYLYTKDYPDAEIQASAVISNSSEFSLVDLNDVFLANSNEAIWQLQPVGTDINSNSGEGMFFILPDGGPNPVNPVFLSDDLVNSFETGDLRKDDWTANTTDGTTTFYYPYKYKIGFVDAPAQEYMMIFRLGEQYLIRAEAEAQDNKLAAAVNDLNILRTRARGPNPGDLPALSTSLGQQAVLDAVAHERQVELFTELGHRWFDLKRTGKIDAVMSTVAPQKGITWNTNWQLYPIPTPELQKDQKLIQNPGYQN